MDDARAALWFEAALGDRPPGVPDLREAWLGLAAARLRLGRSSVAADALHAAVARHVLPPGIDALASAIARASGAPGWCGVAPNGRLHVAPDQPDMAVDVLLDGAPLPSPFVPQVGGFRLPRAVSSVAVRIDGREAIGSPLSPVELRRVQGVVAARDGGLAGWAWHPADPDRRPALSLIDAAGRRRAVRLKAEGAADCPDAPSLSRPRGFQVAKTALRGLTGPFVLRGSDGGQLLGSPLDPCAATAPPPAGTGRGPPTKARRRAADIVVCVAAPAAATRACLDRLLAQAERGVRIVVVDDATEDAELCAALDRLASRRRITLIRHAEPLGQAAAINAGCRAGGGRDVALLDSGVCVSPGWLAALRDAAYAAPDIGSASALTDADARLSDAAPARAVMSEADPAEHARLARVVNRGATAPIPFASASCVYLRRDCLDAVGPFREDVFGQGDGATEDFSLRAARLGWRHVAAGAVFAAGPAGPDGSAAIDRRLLRPRNRAVLERLHPDLPERLAALAAADPLAHLHRRLDAARWRAAGQRAVGLGGPRSVILASHAHGGGVERVLAARAQALSLAGVRPIILRPARRGDGTAGVAVADGRAPDAHPDLVYAVPSEFRRLAALLRADRPERIELHHLMGHHGAMPGFLARLGVPCEVFVHDYALFCPRIALVGPAGRYCGEPAVTACESCAADPARPVALDTPVRTLIDQSADLLRSAARAVAPSADTARRLRRHFPFLRAEVEPPEPAAVPPAEPCPDPLRPVSGRVAVVGAIGVEKGFEILRDCARDAAARQLPLDFVVVGHTIDDATLIRTGRVFVTGEFEPAEAVELIRRQRPSLGLLPSVWPETWCFAASDMWRAGLRVAAFDIGAQAERIRSDPARGLLLPLGLPPPAINNALLAAARGDRGATR